MKKLIKKDTLLLILSALLAISGFLIIGTAYGFFKLPKLVEEINNAAIGAIITAFITVMLLKQQTASVETKERNSKIFEKKLNFVESFLNDLKLIIIDRKISDEEETKLIFQISNLRLHCPKDICDEVMDQITNIKNLLESSQEDKNAGLSKCLNEIALAFRKEIYELTDEEKKDSKNDKPDSIESKSDNLFENDKDIRDNSPHYFVLNTDRKNDTEAERQMLKKRIGTIYSDWKRKLEKIKANDIVFLYTSRKGIVAMGLADGKISELPDEKLCSINISNEFREFDQPIKADEIKGIINGNIVFLQTLFSLKPDAGKKLLEHCKSRKLV